MKIESIKQVGNRNVYDISVADVEHYVLKNGVVTHNTGAYYSATNIYIIGRQQEKEGTEVVGYNFVINVEKSRHSREKSKIPVTVTHEDGINRWSGLIDIALETKHVIKPSNGWYSRVLAETGEVEAKKWRLTDTNCAAFWEPVFKDPSFNAAIEQIYRVSTGAIMSDADIDAEMNNVGDEE